MNQLKLNHNFIMAVLVFGLAMTVYLFTLAPTIYAEDAGELITAAYTLGVAHPPGFPLYALLGKLFTLIPLGNIAWRVNLMSAFFGALTVSLLGLILNRLTKNKIIAFSFSLVFAFSPIFWSQSVIAEVYTLNSFFVALLTLVLLVWQEKKKNKYLFWFSFFYGLSLTNHTMMILLAPVFTAYILFVDKKIIKNWKLIGGMFLLFLFGLSVYFYIPFRAFQRPAFNWGPIGTWHDVMAHIGRLTYNDFSPLTNQFGKVGIFVSFLAEIYNQFFLPTLLLALAGAVYVWKKNKPLAILTAGIFLFSSLGIIYLRKFGWALGVDYTYRVYYLPAFIIVVVWMSVIAGYLHDFLTATLKNKKEQILKGVKAVFYLIILTLPASFLIANYHDSDQSGFWLGYDYAKNLLDSMEPGSIYYFDGDGSLAGDTEIFSLIYLKTVEGFRPDVTVASVQNFFYRDVYLKLPDEHFDLSASEQRQKLFELLLSSSDRPLYTNFAVTKENNDLGIYTRSNGYVHKVYPSFEEAFEADLDLYQGLIRNLDEYGDLANYPPTAGLISHYYYNLAFYYLSQGNKEKANDYLIKAVSLDLVPFSHEYRRFLTYRGEWLEGLR
ncbi:DUF2723 domain-containing protein [Candidatus Falkowbacteria bacterium]|nr:DUF2723 domain-containing protein [Candidatus Falkowbacteria bacterium]